jgi:GTP-binding protein Era
MSEAFRCGNIALVGRPNSGKSTLLNRVLGQKVSIISSKPQTTRNRIVGIHTTETMQAILVDTPGIHYAKSRLNKAMVQAAVSSLDGVDIVCWVIDADKMKAQKRGPGIGRALEHIAVAIERVHEGHVVIALNKADKMPKAALLPLMAALGERLPGKDIVPISALRGKGIRQIVELWKAMLPTAPAVFPADQIMDGTEKFLVSELIREKVFQMTKQEVPYSTAVDVEAFREEQRDEGPMRVEIFAKILVERSSQKGIIIGKQGSMLKRIGTAARLDIQRLLGVSVHLDLHVAVKDRWTSNPRLLHELGYE